MKTYTARDVETLVAERLFGWRKISYTGNPPCVQGLRPDDEDSDYRTEVPHYLTDANADAEVRAAVCGTTQPHWVDVVTAVIELCHQRACRDGVINIHRDALLIRYELPGDWTLAFASEYLGVDVLDLERMVRDG